MISKTSGYAIRSLIYIALKSTEERKISIYELAHELDVPQPFLGKILQGLVKRDIISSMKGPHGGFHANRNTLNTSLISIVDAIEGLSIFKRCFLSLPECNGESPCPLHEHVAGIRDEFYSILSRLTIHDMMKEVSEGHSYLSKLNLIPPEFP